MLRHCVNECNLQKLINTTNQTLKYITDPALRSQLEQELVRLQLEYNKALSEQTILTIQTKSKDIKKTVSNEPHVSDIDQGVIYVFKIKEDEIEKLNIKTPYVYDILYAVVDGLIEKINNNPIWLNELHTLMKNKAYLQIKTTI